MNFGFFRIFGYVQGLEPWVLGLGWMVISFGFFEVKIVLVVWSEDFQVLWVSGMCSN